MAPLNTIVKNLIEGNGYETHANKVLCCMFLFGFLVLTIVNCARSWTFQHKSWNLCLLLWCLPPSKINYLITWNFRDTLISRFWGSYISRHLNFAILPKFCILTHFNFAFLSETHYISSSMLFKMSLNLIKQINQQRPSKQKRNLII